MSQEIKKLKKKADIIFSKYIRYRDGQVRDGQWQTICITCGVWRPTNQMQAGHFVSRSCNLLRYDEENVNGQCMPCNVMKHGDQYEYAKQLNLKYCDNTAEKLHNQRRTSKKWTAEELELIIKEAKEYIKELEEL